jgi:hypothetical protein
MSRRIPEVVEIEVSLFSWRRHSCLPGRDSSRPSSGVTACAGNAEMSLRTPEVTPANLAVGETELGRNAVVWQPILAAGGLSSPPGGLKGRLQARLPATQSTHIAPAGLTSISTTSGVRSLGAADKSVCATSGITELSGSTQFPRPPILPGRPERADR